MQGKSIKILGLMSGTSLDGLDMALCEFEQANQALSFKLLVSETVLYEPVWKERLQNAFEASAEQYFKLHSLYGEFIAEKVNAFLENNNQTDNYNREYFH